MILGFLAIAGIVMMPLSSYALARALGDGRWRAMALSFGPLVGMYLLYLVMAWNGVHPMVLTIIGMLTIFVLGVLLVWQAMRAARALSDARRPE
ncbi:hypothetical protein [Pseudaestuariivita atlantica]|nr:hypothetical protein [Pseudaestuariivita atlantica]